MKEYLDLLQYVLDNGVVKTDRTGTGTKSIFGYQMRIDLSNGFPLLTTKKVIFASVLKELLWFLRGSTNIHDGLDCGIWDAWADENGELGPIYGYQWRKWEQFTETAPGVYQKGHIDQIQLALDTIKTNPDSRRIIVSAWNVADLDRMGLPACHSFFQFYVVNGRLDCQLYQRSADIPVGVPFNIASYALLTMMMAQECKLRPGYFIHTFGDAHIYLNQMAGITEQLSRTPGTLPKIKIADKSFWDLVYDDFELLDYHPQPFIKFAVAV